MQTSCGILQLLKKSILCPKKLPPKLSKWLKEFLTVADYLWPFEHDSVRKTIQFSQVTTSTKKNTQTFENICLTLKQLPLGQFVF